MALNIEIPNDISELKQQIKVLEHQVQQDTTKKDIKVHTAALKKLKEELLYREYLSMQSKEFKEDVTGYEKLIMQGVDVAIKVNFTWGWLRVYQRGNDIEWY